MGACQGVLRGCGLQLSLMLNTFVVSNSQFFSGGDHPLACTFPVSRPCIAMRHCPYLPATHITLGSMKHAVIHPGVTPASFGLQGFWLVGVTLSWALAFKVPMGVIGLWIGTAVGDSTCGT